MPLNSPIHNRRYRHQKEGGRLYVVATPIGNLDDITLRAIDVLGQVDSVAAEDTRQSKKLLLRHNLTCRLLSYHEHNEIQRAAELVEQMKAGASVALISSAGTPTISDPGYRLIRKAIDSGIEVVPLPGPNAAVAALSVSGLPTDSFIFIGFAPRKQGKRRQLLRNLEPEPRTTIFYESPRRIIPLIEDILSIMGDRDAVLSREMTKIHEEFIRGPLSEIRLILERRTEVKGECTLLVGGAVSNEDPDPRKVQKEIRRELAAPETTLSRTVRSIADRWNIPRRRAYQEALKIKIEEKPKRDSGHEKS